MSANVIARVFRRRAGRVETIRDKVGFSGNVGVNMNDEAVTIQKCAA
jgi:hypothetical protein